MNLEKIRTSDTKKIVVLGAGYGGILAAKKLAKKLKKHEDVEITIIDKNCYHTMLTELHEVAAARVPEEAVKINLQKVFAGRNVNVFLDEVKAIDTKNKVLKGHVTNYEYDYLVIGTGSRPTYYGIKGAREHTLPLWSYEDSVRIKEHILDRFRRAACEKNPHEMQKYLTFIVVGCGFTGIEMVGELAEWRDKLCEDFHINCSEVRLYVVDMLPTVLPMCEPSLIKKTEKRLKKLRVEVLTKTVISEVSEHDVCINETGCIETRTVIWTAGIEGSKFVENHDFNLNGRGRIVTNKYLQTERHEEIYVVGDNIFYIPEGEERPVPQMVENAEHSASTVAKNIVADIKGEEKKEYKPSFHGFMVCIGGRYGIAQLQFGKKKLKISGFFALVIKHFINLIYFIQVAGFNKIWTYAMHEVFHVPDRRSLFGGHFAKASPNFWLVPLRIFIGYKWLEQGLHKLPDVLSDPTKIFLIPAKVSATSGATVEAIAEAVVDATSAATQATGATAEAVTTWGAALPVPEFIQTMVNWSMDLMFYTQDGGFTFMATLFQTVMVLGEIAVGLMLIAGLFTAVGSIWSILMGMMIWASGMAPFEMLWYMIGSCATIGGSGSTFGMDYYVLPYLKKKWKKLKFVRKLYIYTD